MEVVEQVRLCIAERDLAPNDAPVLLMVSGGSDSTALAYIACELRAAGALGPLAMLHVNHRLRGEDSDADEAFVVRLAKLLDVPLTCASVDVGAIADAERGNVEAVARRERYAVARTALADFCQHVGTPASSGRIFVAHTADDRVENFYMRSIVGTGPGGFRSMRYLNGPIARPLLDCGRGQLRDYLIGRIVRELPVVRADDEMLWREDATNGHVDRFRAYVRHEIVPRAEERNPRLLDTLGRTMNLIGDEDDLLGDMARALFEEHVCWIEPAQEGCVLSPFLAAEHVALQRRVALLALEGLIGAGERIDTAAVEAVLAGFAGGKPNSGYVANIQGDLAVSANKRGVRIEPMVTFRRRRNRL